ncbi:MAG TPA: phosphotransferase [Acidimicrobiia bacterium]|nr:phosphotransferase [Acidimicrobiia bacterium]
MAVPADPALPLIADLLDVGRARSMLEAAVGPATISDLRLVGVAYRPGSHITTRYDVTLAGAPDRVSITAMHGESLPDGGLRLASGIHEVALWRFPDDPGLPGLKVVLEAEGLERILGELGIGVGPASIRLRAYQPGRRAVVEVRTSNHRLFAKVVRPKRVAELQRLHRSLAPAVPIPRSLGWEPNLGIVILEAIPGFSVAAALVGGSARGVAGPDELIGLLDLIEQCDVDGRPRPPPVVRAPDHAAALGLIAPEAANDAAWVAEAVSEAPAEPPITAHRDFHASQLLVHEGSLRLVDVDTVGKGTRADDLAMLLAQVTCLAQPGPNRVSVVAYRDLAARRFEELTERRSLRLRTAAAILGFAQGPFRIQAADWRNETVRRIDEARRLAEM